MPDGRMLVTTQPGRLRVVSGGDAPRDGRPRLSPGGVCSNSERGLLGVATDPDAGQQGDLPLLHAKGSDTSCPTSSGANPTGRAANRVSKFVLRDDNTVDPASETILLDGIYSTRATTTRATSTSARTGTSTSRPATEAATTRGTAAARAATTRRADRNVLNGKILRITRTAASLPTTRSQGTGTARCQTAPAAAGTTCQEIFATGLRNPFRFAFDPDAATTSFRINDVGQNVWEEIDQGVKGADYGWNAREGHCAQTGSESNCGAATPAGFTDPVHDYGHSTGCASITGGAYVPDGVWPRRTTGPTCSPTTSAARSSRCPPAACDRVRDRAGSSSAVIWRFGPHGSSKALYYTTYAGAARSAGSPTRARSTARRPPPSRPSPASGPPRSPTTLDGSAAPTPTATR
jgi:glucose/arabinose dehydrogenase